MLEPDFPLHTVRSAISFGGANWNKKEQFVWFETTKSI